ncbi:MAG: DUF1828 domain-containing protein [Actinobacteria bacterium]|nr:DUF1828 domain-containing protein [Actinomycetota bacterium]
MIVKNIQKSIRASIKSYFGNDLKYALIKAGITRYTLVTPYLDDKNDFIELEIYFDNKKRVVVTDFGKALDHLLEGDIEFCREGSLYMKVREITDRAGVDIRGYKFRVKNSLNNAGESVSSMIKALQGIYNLSPSIKKSAKDRKSEFSSILDEIYRRSPNGNTGAGAVFV